jgi:hypothetical protein
MNEQIIIVDNFYDEPFHYHKGFDDQKCIVTDETIGKLEQIVGNSIQIVRASNQTENISGVLAHLQSDWIALIYLTLPLQSFGETGVKFYSHIQTNLECFPNDNEIKKYEITEHNISKIFDSNLSLWKEYGNIPAKYNRMVLFKSNRWHSYYLNTSIRYQIITIKNA